MKLKLIAAACMSLCASSAFAAAAAVTCTTTATTSATAALNMVNTCAPEAKLFVAGSSALGGAMSAVVPADLFDTTATPLVKVKDLGSANGGATGGANAVTAWYGMSKAAVTGGTSKRLFVVYNNNNGSAAGVSQLLAKLGTVAEADVVTVGPTSKTAANACTEDAASTTAAPVIDCTTHAATQADVAISDVSPTELYKLYATATAKLSTLTSTPLALQGFAVAVNPNLYNKLQAMQIASGALPSTCAAGDYTLTCQPSIARADYASLVTKEGSVKSAAALTGDAADATQLVLARRDDLSGTQASSNIFFADNACGGVGYNSTSKVFNWAPGATKADKVSAAIMGGGLDIVSITDYPASTTAALVVQSNATTGGVKTALNATTGYAIGVISLNSAPGASDTWKYVKIDGSSPNFNADGSAAYKARTAFINGGYGFAMTSFAAVPTKAPKTGVATTFPLVISTLISGLKDSTLHDLTGIGYLDGAADVAGTPKQSHVHRINGNNCSPLIM
jgi:hypothetical protein